MKHYWDSLILSLWTSDPRAVKSILTLSSLIWGLMFLIQGDVFYRPQYVVMEYFMSQHLWGWAFFGYGVISLWCNAPNVIKFLISLLGASLWTITTYSMMLSVWPFPPSASSNIVLSLASLWILLRSPTLFPREKS